MPRVLEHYDLVIEFVKYRACASPVANKQPTFSNRFGNDQYQLVRVLNIRILGTATLNMHMVVARLNAVLVRAASSSLADVTEVLTPHSAGNAYAK